MQLFTCPACQQRLFFANVACACGVAVVYDPDAATFHELASEGCANRDLIACNWRAETEAGLCRSCAMTAVTPDTGLASNVSHWAETEQAKRWVLANLARWGWFRDADQGPRPTFHMLAEATTAGATEVSMGHDSGLVTLNVSEADPATRVARQESFGEPIRTMTGHLRHEIAHFFFDRWARENAGFLEGFRQLFGDERADYGAALARYYQDGPPPGFEDVHISAYAASHPHEDWAESFAHVLHLTDIVDSFMASRLTAPDLPDPDRYDAYAERDPERLIGYGARLGIALNHVNRSIGRADLYPFVHTPAIVEKFSFVHRHLVGAAATDRPHGLRGWLRGRS